MSECHQYIFKKNSNLIPSSEFKDEILLRGVVLYEVVRIIEGKPIFIHDHYKRLLNSAVHIKQTIWISFEKIESSIEELIKVNDTKNGNLKLVFQFDDGSSNFLAYFLKHYYPTEEQYQYGVRTIVLPAERPIPNAKVYNPKLRTKANTLIKEAEIFEVLLLNSLGNLTEGSRSNLFFIRDNEIHTAPDTEVLHGIVRTKVLEICNELEIPLHKHSIHYDDLANYQAAFLTGTSLKVLPIQRINSISYDNTHPILQQILNSLQMKMDKYL